MKSQIFRGFTGGFFLFSFLWSPLWNEENKNCLNKLQLCDLSGNPKSSLCWKFHMSISKIGKSPQNSGSSLPNRDLLFISSIQTIWFSSNSSLISFIQVRALQDITSGPEVRKIFYPDFTETWRFPFTDTRLLKLLKIRK